jgi:hypothetical protein
MTSLISWKFVIVTRSFEKIRVLRARDGKAKNIHGTMPKGFSCHLSIGDRVFVKVPGKRWMLKFELMIHPRRKYPAIKYGKRYGPYPGQYRDLRGLAPGAFANAGIDPTWI